MGLAVSQYSLLRLTKEKAYATNRKSLLTMDKLSLMREMSNLELEKSNLQAKSITYYNNGKYNKVNYAYLMGPGKNYAAILNGSVPVKEDNNMILTDYKGQVVMSDTYANAIKAVLGNSICNGAGKGNTFPADNIPDILAELFSTNVNGESQSFGSGFTADAIRTVLNGGTLDSEYTAVVTNSLSGQRTGSVTVNNSEEATSLIKSLIDFYYPIFNAAASNGWTTEYNNQIQSNPDAISDYISSGVFALMGTEEGGQYEQDVSTNYFITAGIVNTTTDAEKAQEITVKYNRLKEELTAKENAIDLQIQDLSTLEEIISNLMQQYKQMVNTAVKGLSFGSNA